MTRKKLSKAEGELFISMDYCRCMECKNEEAIHTCLKCGKCGRIFENGFMADDRGTTIEEEDE